MKIAIVIATYMRSDRKSPAYVKRALESVLNQTHKDYKIYLIGDNYEGTKEFKNFTRLLKSVEFYSENLKKAVEREKYGLNDRRLWCCGGVNAFNYGIQKALDDGYEWVSHLDHDDYWEPNHLYNINQAIENLESCGFVYTCSSHINGQHLPYVELDNTVVYSYPVPCNVIHSSVCINHKLLPLKYRDVFAETGQMLEADIDMWNRVTEYSSKNNINSVLIKQITCHHKEEGLVR